MKKLTKNVCSKKNKSYCFKCTKFFSNECFNQINLKFETNWYKIKIINKNKPSKLNKNSDCQDYEKKEKICIGYETYNKLYPEIKLENLNCGCKYCKWFMNTEPNVNLIKFLWDIILFRNNYCNHESNINIKPKWNFPKISFKKSPKNLNIRNVCKNFTYADKSNSSYFCIGDYL